MGQRLPFLIAFVLAACSPAGSPPAPSSAPSPPSPEVTELPAVPLATLAGDHTDIAQLAGGRVALVTLWATWCESCQKEMDALNRLQAATAEGGDAIVIGVDVGEEPEAVAAFARRRGLRYTQLVDENFELADAVGRRRVPCTLIVDRRGRVVFRGDALDARALEALRRTIAQPAQ